MRRIALALSLLAAQPLAAETFTLSLGSRAVGQMSLTSERLDIRVDESPLGVADGTFAASSRMVRMEDGRVVRQYLSDAPRKSRKISILHDAGTVIDTTVSPSSDATEMSAPAAVPQGVVDFVQGLNVITAASACPGGMTLYEGRRLIRLDPTGSTSDGATRTCDYSYRVTGGPGHLRPLSIRNATVQIAYTSGRLARITASSGPFSVHVTPGG